MKGLFLFVCFSVFSLSVFRLISDVSAKWDDARRDVAVRFFLVALFLLGLIVFFQVNIIHDAFQYYGYLVSACLDGDLNLYDEIYLHNAHRFYNPFPQESARYMGTAVCQAPFLMMGHALSRFLSLSGQSCVQNGYSFPYLLMVSLASPLFAFTGLLFCYMITREFFSRTVSMMAVVGVWFASPLVFFMYSWNGWAHPFAFCLVSGFILLWLRTRGQRTIWQWLLLGLVGSVVGLVRPFSGIVFLLPIIEVLKERRSPRSLLMVGMCGVAALFVFSPQLSLWKAMSGNWLAMPYAEVGDSHNWLKPDFLGVLFSVERHGLITWTPLLLPAAAGLWFFCRKDRLFANVSIAMVLFAVYFYACWSIWWTGIGFSNRFFLSLTPLFILGLASLIDRLAVSFKLSWIWSVISFFIIGNIMMIGAYRMNIIPQGIPDPYRVVDEPLCLADLWVAVFEVMPSRVSSLLGGIWINENFFARELLGSIRSGDYIVLFRTTALLVGVLAFVYCIVWLVDNARGKGPSGLSCRVACGTGCVIVLLLHIGVWSLRSNAEPMGPFYHFDEVSMTVQAGGEDMHLYCDYPVPVEKVDLLTHLTYGHAVEHGAIVAEVTVTGIDGKEIRKSILCGRDTAEASVFRKESAAFLQHDTSGVDVVRLLPTRMFSESLYEEVVCRMVIDLPAQMIVRRIKIRYAYPFGRLVVSDVFLR